MLAVPPSVIGPLLDSVADGGTFVTATLALALPVAPWLSVTLTVTV